MLSDPYMEVTLTLISIYMDTIVKLCVNFAVHG